MHDLTQRNVKLWQEMQRGFLESARGVSTARGAKNESADTDAD